MKVGAALPRPSRRETHEPSDPKPHGLHDELADFSTDRRVLVLSGMAVGIGVVAALVAYALVWLIAVITNLAYYQRFSSHFVSPAGNRLGLWAVLIPVVGGLVIGIMARYGSEKIRGHGIPEALEAILIGRSRVEPKGRRRRWRRAARRRAAALRMEAAQLHPSGGRLGRRGGGAGAAARRRSHLR